MQRRTSNLALAVALAALAPTCGGDAAPAAPTVEMGERHELASGTRYVGYLGFAFEVPDGWRIEPLESGATLVPPAGAAVGAHYAVAFRPVPGVTSSRDSDLPAVLADYAADDGANLAPLADTGSFASRGGDGVVVDYEAEAPSAGPEYARVYAIVEDGWTLLLRGVAPPAALFADDDALTAIASTLEFVAPRVDEQLVGAWYSDEVSEPGVNEEGETYWSETEKWLKLLSDGSVRLRTYWKITTSGHSDSDLVESNGRWAIYGDRLFRLYEDKTRGLHRYLLSGSGAKRELVLEPEGDIEEPTQQWREDPDIPF